MPMYSSIENFKDNHPLHTHAIQCVFVSPQGEIAQHIMPIESWHAIIQDIMTSYVFVNDWKSIIHTIEI